MGKHNIRDFLIKIENSKWFNDWKNSRGFLKNVKYSMRFSEIFSFENNTFLEEKLVTKKGVGKIFLHNKQKGITNPFLWRKSNKNFVFRTMGVELAKTMIFFENKVKQGLYGNEFLNPNYN